MKDDSLLSDSGLRLLDRRLFTRYAATGLGGMALANGLLVSGPTSWAAAVVDDRGQVIVGSGPAGTRESLVEPVLADGCAIPAATTLSMNARTTVSASAGTPVW